VIGSMVKVQVNNDVPVAGTINIEYEQLYVGTIAEPTKPDPSWEFVDAAGHFHAYDIDGKLPTLVAKTYADDSSGGDLEPDDDPDGEWDDQPWSITVDACRICGEHVTPGRIPAARVDYMPGRMHWTVTVARYLPVGGNVTVRIDMGATMAFGVGLVTAARVGRSATSEPVMVGESTIIGNGPLGRRKVEES
jgi:hypothetical protein